MNVRDYMSTHVVYLKEGDLAVIARRPMLDFGISAVPVLDDDRRPVGLVSLSDLADDKRDHLHASHAVHTITPDATIEDAARALATHDVHHLVVVDVQGVAVGVISTLDVVRALIGMPSKQPTSIRRFVAVSSDEFESEYRRE